MSERFIARVVDVKDPEQAGRLKIRIFGLHDDTTRVSDESLPWARCIFPVTNPIYSGVAGFTTGVVVNTIVTGRFADGDGQAQIPLIEGTLGRNSDAVKDFPKINNGEDFNEVIEDGLLKKAVEGAKFPDVPTIGPIVYSGQPISDALNVIGEGSISGIVSSMKDTLSSITNIKSGILNGTLDDAISSIDGISSSLGSVTEVTEATIGQGGNIYNMADGALDLVDQSTSFGTSVQQQYNNVNHLISSIGSSASSFTSVADIAKRSNGLTFTMNTSMKSVESTFDSIKSLAGRRSG